MDTAFPCGKCLIWEQGNKLFEMAVEKGFVISNPDLKRKLLPPIFQPRWLGGRIDFSNPEAVEWYQESVGTTAKNGGSSHQNRLWREMSILMPITRCPQPNCTTFTRCCIKKRPMKSQKKLPVRVSFGRGPVGPAASAIRSTGAETCACTWDGLAGSLRGGLHLGLSGFAFWSHDVPGFHGVPNFMNSWPADDLYVRWTQFGVFTSHFRYHGACPREPYEYPAIADIVRQWWKLRYALIPYLAEQGKRVIKTGLPMLRASDLSP